MNIQTIAPYLSGVGFTLISIDENETGADDVAGQFLIYGGEVINAVSLGIDLPPLPDVISERVAGKIGNAARGVLMGVGTFLTILQMQIAASEPRLAAVLRYVSQGIAAVLAGRAIPALTI